MHIKNIQMWQSFSINYETKEMKVEHDTVSSLSATYPHWEIPTLSNDIK